MRVWKRLKSAPSLASSSWMMWIWRRVSESLRMARSRREMVLRSPGAMMPPIKSGLRSSWKVKVLMLLNRNWSTTPGSTNRPMPRKFGSPAASGTLVP